MVVLGSAAVGCTVFLDALENRMWIQCFQLVFWLFDSATLVVAAGYLLLSDFYFNDISVVKGDTKNNWAISLNIFYLLQSIVTLYNLNIFSFFHFLRFIYYPKVFILWRTRLH